MKAKAIVRLKFRSEQFLKIVKEALTPEIKMRAPKRSKTSLEKSDDFLILFVEAKDTVALRATLNSYLRWINSVINVLETLEKNA